MAMVDVLCHMKEKALNEVNPHLFTIATLTGHQFLSHAPYSAIMDNGPAKKERFAQLVIYHSFIQNMSRCYLLKIFCK